MDGNFSAEHLSMRRPDDDVVISDGTGFFVSELDYKSHLTSAVELATVESSAVNSSSAELNI